MNYELIKILSYLSIVSDPVLTQLLNSSVAVAENVLFKKENLL